MSKTLSMILAKNKATFSPSYDSSSKGSNCARGRFNWRVSLQGELHSLPSSILAVCDSGVRQGCYMGPFLFAAPSDARILSAEVRGQSFPRCSRKGGHSSDRKEGNLGLISVTIMSSFDEVYGRGRCRNRVFFVCIWFMFHASLLGHFLSMYSNSFLWSSS